MEQKLRFGLVLDHLAVMKKNWGQLLATFEGSFFMFSLAKINKSIVGRYTRDASTYV